MASSFFSSILCRTLPEQARIKTAFFLKWAPLVPDVLLINPADTGKKDFSNPPALEAVNIAMFHDRMPDVLFSTDKGRVRMLAICKKKFSSPLGSPVSKAVVFLNIFNT